MHYDDWEPIFFLPNIICVIKLISKHGMNSRESASARVCDHHCSKVVTVFRFLTFKSSHFLMGAWGATGKNDDDDDDDEDKDKSEIENSRKLIRHLRSFFFFSL